MNNKNIFFLSVLLIGLKVQAQDLSVIRATEINENDYRFETTLEKYQNSENWKIWSFPFNHSDSTLQLPSTDSSYISNVMISDTDLKTAWVANDSASSIGKKFEFTFQYPEFSKYGTAYQFNGKVNVFNGNCQSIIAWTEYSRIKTLKVYYNNIPICLIELSDIWHFQNFDIGQFFKNKYSNKYLEATYEIESGDTLAFEIIDVYSGIKYKHVALSEFLVEGAKN